MSRLMENVMKKEPEYLLWRQTDPHFNETEAWPAGLFPEAQYRYFGDAGCLVCSLAVMLRHYGLETEDGPGFDPLILNERLIRCGAFDPSADLDLSYIRMIYPLEYAGAVAFSREALERITKSGGLCLITVPGQNAEYHFLAYLRPLPGDAEVFDPLHGTGKLSAYPRICGIRVFRRV